MKQLLCLFTCIGFSLCASAQLYNGITLYDMYEVPEVKLLTYAETNELKAELAEERRMFPKAVATAKKNWDALQKAAVKAGIKDYPKFPRRLEMKVRRIKIRGGMNKVVADKWLEKQISNTDEEMAELAAARKAAIKAAKASATNFKGKKAQRKADQADMEAAVAEKVGEKVEAELAKLLKYNRPVPKIFIIDPIGGPEKYDKISIVAQEAKIKAYQERKAKALAEEAAAAVIK